MKKTFFLWGVLLASCASESGELVVDTEVTQEDEVVETENDSCEEWPSEYEKMDANLTNSEGYWYELEEWNLQFVLPLDYAAMNVFQSGEGDDLRIIVDDVSTPGCLPVGDSMDAVFISMEPYPSYEAYKADDVNKGRPFEETASASNFFDFQRWEEDYLGGSTIQTNFLEYEGKLYSISGITACPNGGVPELCTANSELMQTVLRNMQALHQEEALMSQYVEEALSLNLSNEYDEYTLAERSEDYRDIKVDEENYYATLVGGWEGQAYLTVFIKPDGTHLLVISVLGCGPMCNQDLFFFERRNSKWVPASDDIFPYLSDAEQTALAEEIGAEDFLGLYELPQFGTDITYVNQYDWSETPEIHYLFSWEGGRFVKKKL